MPTRPPTLEAMRFAARAPAIERTRNARRAIQKAVYNSKRWKILRNLILGSEPLCRACKVHFANEVDHIIDIIDGGDCYDYTNLQPLCKPCHSAKTHGGNMPIRPNSLERRTSLAFARRHKCYVITGAAGSGKTTYARKHSTPGDMVWDYDAVCDALFAMPQYPRPPHVHTAMLNMMNAAIGCALEDTCTSYLIIADQHQATSIAKRLGAVVMTMPKQREDTLS